MAGYNPPLFNRNQGDKDQLSVRSPSESCRAKLPSEFKSPFLENHEFIDVAAGDTYIVAVTVKGEVFWWGEVYNGQRSYRQGKDLKTNLFTPRKITFGPNTYIKKVWAGSVTNYALDTDGFIWIWGNSNLQNLKHRVKTWKPHRFLNTETYPIAEMFVRSGFTLAILNNGNIIGWGNNNEGILGPNKPKHFETCENFENNVFYEIGICAESLSVGCCHAAATMSDGSVLLWGSYNSGQFGNTIWFYSSDPNNHSSKPMQLILPEGEKCKKVFCVGDSTFFISKDGKVFGTGDNTYSQLGIRSRSGIGFDKKLEFVRVNVNADEIYGNKYMTAFLSRKYNEFSIAGRRHYGEKNTYEPVFKCTNEYFSPIRSHPTFYPDKIIFGSGDTIQNEFSVLFRRNPNDEVKSGDSIDVEKILEQTREFLSS